MCDARQAVAASDSSDVWSGITLAAPSLSVPDVKRRYSARSIAVFPDEPLYRASLADRPFSPLGGSDERPSAPDFSLHDRAHNVAEPAAGRASFYNPPLPPYVGPSGDYAPYDPWNEAIVPTSQPVGHVAPVTEDIRPPEYDDSLMDDWLFPRAISEIPASTRTLEDLVSSVDDTFMASHVPELDGLAARMDPSAPDAFRRLCDLPIDDLDEDQLFTAAAMLNLFRPPDALDPGPGSTL
jgi:hypothetical protein